MRNRGFAVLAALGFLISAAPLFAHHGVGVFDQEHSISVKGTVTEFAFVNPHVEIYFDAKDDKGNVEKWVAESGSPNLMRRSGWSKVTLKPGDQVTFVGYPARKGVKGMRLEKIVLPNGQDLLPEKTMD